MAAQRIYHRDRRGRFAHRGATVTMVVRRSASGAKTRTKLAGASRYNTPRRESSFLRWAVGEGDRTRRTGKAWASHGVKGGRRSMEVGPGTRRRGQTIRKISRISRKTRTRGAVPYGALGRSGFGTGRRRSVMLIGKTKTSQVRRGQARRLPGPRRKTSRR